MIGYFIVRKHGSGKMWAGTTPKEIAATIENELENQDAVKKPDDFDEITIECVEITQEEIDNMPDFDGW